MIGAPTVAELEKRSEAQPKGAEEPTLGRERPQAGNQSRSGLGNGALAGDMDSEAPGKEAPADTITVVAATPGPQVESQSVNGLVEGIDQEAPADTPDTPEEAWASFMKELDRNFADIKTRISGIEQTITQMGAEPSAGDQLTKWVEHPVLGPTIKEILAATPELMKEIPRALFGGGSSNSSMIRLVAEEVEKRETEHISSRIKEIVDAVYSGKEIYIREGES